MRVPGAIKSAVLEPTTARVTALISIIYAAVFIASVVVHEIVPAPPSKPNQRGLDLDQAWLDLQQSIASAYSGVEVLDDLISNGTYADAQIVYFEGDNLLVKIDGTDTSLPAVLFSAHFDSVSTGLGATDDGMGVVTLIQLVEYYASRKPARTVIFNINNGEEDWLNGAHAFLDHPWSRLPTTFLNLEGAGNGGRPMLFRTSSFDVTSAFRAVSRPHGSTLSSDAFKRRLVRSGTDFSVYEEAGMKGLDLAFYRQRSRYHTTYDSVSWLGHKGSLWLMMENALEAGNSLVSRKSETANSADAVYFDIFGRAMVVISQGGMLTLNVLLLVLGPIAIAVVLASAPGGYRASFQKFAPEKKAWVRGPVMLVVSLIATLGLAAVYSAANAYIVYSSAYTVAISLVAVAICSLALSSRVLSKYLPTADHVGQTVADHAFFTALWWILLCWATGQLNVNSLGGFYYVTFAYAGQLVALTLCLTSTVFLNSPTKPNFEEPASASVDNDRLYPEPTERSSLLPGAGHRILSNGHENIVDKSRSTWSLEILASLVFPCILATGTLLMLMTALSQTLADGSQPMTVYLGIGFLALLISLPIAPFISRVHHCSVLVLGLVLLAMSIYNLTAFPFSPANPLKIFFQQSVNLDDGSNRVQLVSVDSFKGVYQRMPNIQLVKCAADTNRLGLTNCAWSGTTPNVTLDSRPMSDWVKFSGEKTGVKTATIQLRGSNTRSCRIYTDQPIISLNVRGGHWERGLGRGANLSNQSFTEARLWSRTWNRLFTVDVEWAETSEDNEYTGRVACEWAEWGAESIPALEEVRVFLPPWAVITKLADGLVEGLHSFTLRDR
ncbi:Peptidase family M28 protein [Ceratobasidium sp. AG-Ba]|nr:Peptidase family M28 protein [Ceratobasidium sp. AG-Ba]QRW12338.1 Peptidase family M28 protein [Ceratobasidium sp. AG-Ba]